MTTTTHTNPAIYVACLASYNNGVHHGDWITLDSSEDIEERIKEILQKSPIPDAEEWAVHDHYYCGNLSEYPRLDALKNIQEAYQQVVDININWSVFCEFCDHLGEGLTTEQVDKYRDQYAGEGDNLKDWCEEYLEDTGELEEIPEKFRSYFDFERYARDMEMNDVFTIRRDGGIVVFWRR